MNTARALPLVVLCSVAACSPVTLLEADLSCTKDSDCGTNALCEQNLCTGCPDVSDCEPPDAPGPWIALTRNGCRLCQFAPPSECTGPDDCDGTCYRGAYCAPGCTRFECCANACSEPGCEGPAPLGCRVRCPFGLRCPRDRCVADSCECEAGEGHWRCYARCADVAPNCGF